VTIKEKQKQNVFVDGKSELDKISSFIIKYEWALHLTAFWDNGRRSIWYGTKSNKGEVITKEEAINRFNNHLVPIYKLVNKDCYTANQKIAIASYIYNTWGSQMNLKYHINQCRYNDIRYIMSVYGWWHGTKYYRWLSKRRNAELNLFNN
jgi:GH24 family phage-related lysozyme (muramidase)